MTVCHTEVMGAPRSARQREIARRVGRAFGERLQLLREAKGDGNLTQEDLAERCELDKSHISRFETGERTPSLEQLGLLACGLGVDVSTLIPRDLKDLVRENLPDKQCPQDASAASAQQSRRAGTRRAIVRGRSTT
jgi:transcriptional regulator with XRE-family HTH domain